MRKFKQFIGALSILLLGVAAPLHAQTPEQKAEAIGDAMEAATQGFGDSQLKMNMSLINKKGKVSKRVFTVKTLEGKNNNPKALLVFATPSDLKGTALLTHAYEEKANDQWLYLPSSKRVKKIASNGSTGTFLGSEFTYEDMGGFDIDDYKSVWVKESSVAGQACDLIENIPTGKSGYSKVTACISKTNKVPLEVKFFDKRKRHLKTLTNSQYKKHNGKYWLAHDVKMTNHITGKATHLKIADVKFKTGLKDSDFSQNVLKRLKP